MKSILQILPILLAALSPVLYAQAPQLDPGSEEKAVPTVVFEYVMPESTPSHYAVTVDSLARAAYRSQPSASQDVPGDPYLMSFVLSGVTRDRIFELTRELDFFQKDFNFKGKVANMGEKTLVFREGAREHRTSYNYSANTKLQELTKIFQGISTTLEFVRRLEQMHRFEPLGLDGELKKLETEERAGRLAEKQLLEPVLSSIAANHTVMNITRRRAQTMLARLGLKDQARR